VALLDEHQSDAVMGILITGQEKIPQLHKEYKGRRYATDVLSFAMMEKSYADEPDFIFPREMPCIWGRL
jgi:ssRNA-specific RNase YbeY (16S rRNA maturation enzyme)